MSAVDARLLSLVREQPRTYIELCHLIGGQEDTLQRGLRRLQKRRKVRPSGWFYRYHTPTRRGLPRWL